jgi:integrase
VTNKRTLNDRILKALKPAPAGKLVDLWDTVVPGFGVRVSDSGRRTFVLVTRYPGSSNPTRRALGTYGALTLEKARGKARDWLELIRQGKDPGLELERQRLAEERRRANTFAAVAEDFIAEKLADERKGREVARDIRREFLPKWGPRAITEITDLDVLTVIKVKKQTAPAQARNLLTTAKRLFAWAVDQRCYGLRTSPPDGLKPAKIVGERVAGSRILNDVELFALWRAAQRTPYPYGPVYRLLILTALRLNECADGAWHELDPANRLWTIPAARMKGRNGKARPHAVPLTDDVMAVLETLPRFTRGEFLFSTTFGEKPVWMSDKVKKRIDQRMLRTMRALARRRGDDPEKVKLPNWTNHDIRRTVRSGLSRLKVTEEAREAIMAHARPGIKGTYDLYDYLDEKGEALGLWAARVQSIVEPRPTNVISLSKMVSSNENANSKRISSD